MNQFRQTSPALSWALTGILILLSATLQTTVLRGIEVFHVIPNLLFIIVVCYGLLHDDYSSLVVGVACGLILDLFGGRTMGMNTLLCVYVAWLCLSVSDNLFNHNAFVSMVFVAVLTVPYEVLTYLFYFVIWGKGAGWYAVFCKILPMVAYNFVFALAIHPIVKKISYFE
ncbi:MAG: rod shape-determining protein MreD [Clostridia bacterium]|nr:rod shape-determining protein MreD [Clostridia bacterium]